MPEVPFDAILVVSFGGPEGPDQVMPFLQNVLRGKNVPEARMLEVAGHYQHFGGVSPINAQNRELIAALEGELRQNGLDLPIYFGNRNWDPLLPDTLRQMQHDGIKNALGFFTSAFSSYSGCRQYRENILQAQQTVGAEAPQVSKLRMFFNHPGYIESVTDRVTNALRDLQVSPGEKFRLAFTAHSIPSAMAVNCRYEAQLRESCRLVVDAMNLPADCWDLVYQSRSGPASQPWLEPDILDHLKSLNEQGIKKALISPIGFISDHLEVLYDLDTEAAALSQELDMSMVRAGTVGTHPRFIRMIRELIEERIRPDSPRLALGSLGASHDVCPVDCCLSGRPAAGTSQNPRSS
ncbi:MAG: ferrochelatase [Planctomycetota bacterium]|nr:ferrochelatase [Planctomycetota bacterium]